MDFDAFKELVEKTKNDHPVWFGMESDEIPDEAAVTEAEGKLGAELPADYINFIFEYGGGYFSFSNVFSLEERSDWNLVDLNYKYDAIRNGYVLISENGSGDFYGFKVVNGVCDSKIYFYDHEVETWQDSTHSNLFDYLEKFALSNQFVVTKGVRHGPLNPGPLDDAVAATFRGGSYTANTLSEATTLYRVYGGNAGKIGSYWTRTKPSDGFTTGEKQS